MPGSEQEIFNPPLVWQIYNHHLIHAEDHEYRRKVAENLQGLQFVIITIVVVMNMCSVHQIHQRAVTDARKNFRRQGGRGLLGAEVLLLLLPLLLQVTLSNTRSITGSSIKRGQKYYCYCYHCCYYSNLQEV